MRGDVEIGCDTALEVGRGGGVPYRGIDESVVHKLSCNFSQEKMDKRVPVELRPLLFVWE